MFGTCGRLVQGIFGDVTALLHLYLQLVIATTIHVNSCCLVGVYAIQEVIAVNRWSGRPPFSSGTRGYLYVPWVTPRYFFAEKTNIYVPSYFTIIPQIKPYYEGHDSVT
jgi:hypothetical protein